MDARHNISISAGSGDVIGYLAEPESSRGPLVLVLHEWKGLSDHIKGVCDELADEGFVAFAPDVYEGRVPHDDTEASSMMDAVPIHQVVADLRAAIQTLLERESVVDEKVGVVGFSMGAAIVFNLASEAPELVAAAVPYYGGPYYEVDLTRVSAPILGHFGSADPWAGADHVDKLRAGLLGSNSPSVDLRVYEGAEHGFVVEGSDAYDPELSSDTWLTSVSFLREHLG